MRQDRDFDLHAGATLRLPVIRIPVRAAAVFACAVAILALLFGGGTRQGFWSDVLVQISALPLLAWALLRISHVPLSGSARWALGLLCATAMLPLIQLIPLPPALWAAIPGRGSIVSGYDTAGMALPWLPISLDPNTTWRAFLSLIPPAAIFLAVLAVGPRLRRLLFVILLVVAGISIVVDVLQMIEGPESGLRFYTITNASRAVGFFANANHNAAFLYAVIPFAVVALTIVALSHKYRTIGILSVVTLLVGIIVALALTHSRAGMALGFLAGILGIGLAWELGRGQMRRRFLIATGVAILVAILISFQFGFVNLAERAEDSDLSKDLRWTIASATSHAALANLPFGSGVGTFVPVYDMFASRGSINAKYVNRAHDDWLEALLEGGVFAALLAVTFLLWFGYAAIEAWRGGDVSARGLDVLLPRAASVAVFLLLLHSAVDYPLRTTGITVMFAFCCALLVPPGKS